MTDLCNCLNMCGMCFKPPRIPPQCCCDSTLGCASFSLSTYKQMTDYVQCFVMAPCSNDVYWVLNRLYKAAPTACATFEWVGGGGQLAMTSQTNANTPWISVFRHCLLQTYHDWTPFNIWLNAGEDCNAFSETTDAFTLGSTALGLEWIFAKTKKWSSIMICP